MKKKLMALLLASLMVVGLVGCGGKDDNGGLIKVGIINNDPNESGYRTANDKDMKAMFTEENGYDAEFAYSLKNDEQISAAQKFIQDGVDYLLLSAADTAGWDSVLKDAQAEGIKVTPQEIEEEVKSLAKRHNMTEEKVRQLARLDLIAYDVALRKATDFIRESCK